MYYRGLEKLHSVSIPLEIGELGGLIPTMHDYFGSRCMLVLIGL